MTDMHREAFEKGMRTGHFETDARNRYKDDIGRYLSDRIQARWEGYQAALQSPAVRELVVPDEITTHDSGGFGGMDQSERDYRDGWNACRKQALANFASIAKGDKP